jgi:hypothetical protein
MPSSIIFLLHYIGHGRRFKTKRKKYETKPKRNNKIKQNFKTSLKTSNIKGQYDPTIDYVLKKLS